MVIRDSGVDALDSVDPASDIADDTVSHNSSIAGAENVDHDDRAALLPSHLESPDREPGDAHTAHARTFDLYGLDLLVPEDANSLRSESPRAGRVSLGGRLYHRIIPAQLYPILADHHVLPMHPPH